MEVIPRPWWESWWFGSVILAVVINLGTSYLKPILDQWWGKYSERQRKVNLKNSALLDVQIQEMLDDQTEVMYIFAMLNRSYFVIFIGIIEIFGALLFFENPLFVSIMFAIGLVTAYIGIRMFIKNNALITTFRQKRTLIRWGGKELADNVFKSEQN